MGKWGDPCDHVSQDINRGKIKVTFGMIVKTSRLRHFDHIFGEL